MHSSRHPNNAQILEILWAQPQQLLRLGPVKDRDQAGAEPPGDLRIAVRGEPHGPTAGVEGGGEPDLGGASHDAVGGSPVGVGEWREGG